MVFRPPLTKLLLGDVFMPCNTIAGITSVSVSTEFYLYLHSLASACFIRSLLQCVHTQQPDLDISFEAADEPRRRQRRGAVDPATKLMVRMAVPIDGKRTFFVSERMAEAFRRESVLKRREEILRRRSGDERSGDNGPAFKFKRLLDRYVPACEV